MIGQMERSLFRRYSRCVKNVTQAGGKQLQQSACVKKDHWDLTKNDAAPVGDSGGKTRGISGK